MGLGMLRNMTAAVSRVQGDLLKRNRHFSSVAPSHALRFLVIDGYAEEGRQQFIDNGATTAGELYRQMLTRASPAALPVIDIIHPADPGFKIPTLEALREYDGIAWTGCSLTVWQQAEDERVSRQIELCRAGFKSGVPSFGSCWALQVASVAAGGQAAANPRGREQGLARKIRLTDAAMAHPMYEGKPRVFDAFSAHTDEVTLLPASGSVHLATNAWTNVQAAALHPPGMGSFWAVQYHPEYNLKELARLTACRAKRFVEIGLFRSEEAVADYVARMERIHEDPAGTRDLAWELGIDADVMDADVREREARNWVKHCVLRHRDAAQGAA